MKIIHLIYFFLFILQMQVSGQNADREEIRSAGSGNWSEPSTWIGGSIPTGSDNVIIGSGHHVVKGVSADPDIDFSNAIISASSGNWSASSTWSNGEVPGANDDVVIAAGHDVYVDMQGTTSGDKVELCTNLKVEQQATLFMGHDIDNFVKALQINGSMLCNGTFSSGREIPGETGDGLLYNYNSRVYFKLNEDSTYINGTGYFHPLMLNLFSPAGEKEVFINLYNVVLDDHFVVKSNSRVRVTTDRYSYINVLGALGLTGSTYQWSSSDAMADLIVNGLIVANNLSLFTKNTAPGEGTSITIKEGGSIFAKSINEGVNRQSEAAGFYLNLEENALFRCAEGVNNPLATAAGDPNFTVSNNGEIREHYEVTMPSNDEIMDSVNARKPTANSNIEELNDIFGASHIAGWYHFTDRPFLLEGMDFCEQFGTTALKTTLTATNGKMYKAYHFNHTWPNFERLIDIAQYEMMDSLFTRDYIKTHTFWVTSKNKGFYKDGPDFNNDVFQDEEQQYYELTQYLLQKYGNSGKTFVYQNWEGDWMLRGLGVNWEDDPSLIPDDVDWVIAGMSRMFRARQRGTERARQEFPEASATILHAIEMNKLWAQIDGDYITMMDNGTPCLTADVIPHCRVDMSSWSAYDGRWSDDQNPFPVPFWQGLEIIDYYTTPTKMISSGIPVMVGEFAINENPPYTSYTEAEIKNSYDLLSGMSLSLGVQNFYLWNVYCNGTPDTTLERETEYETSLLYEHLNGKWVLEPDGSWGYAAEFLMNHFVDEQSNSLTKLNTENQELHIAYANNNKGIRLEMPFNKVSVSIYDMNGKRRFSSAYTKGEIINTVHLSAVYYILRVETPSGAINQKFLVKQ